MKRTFIVFALFFILFGSCNKKFKFYGFDIEKSLIFQVPVGVNEMDTAQSIDLYIDNVFETHDTEADLFEKITIEEVIVDGVGYNNFSDLTFYISANNESEIVLSKNDSIEYEYDLYTGAYGVNQNETNATMNNYIKSSNIDIRIEGVIPDPLTIASSATVNLRFRVLTFIK